MSLITILSLPLQAMAVPYRKGSRGVAGIPARKTGERPRDLNYNFDGKSCRLL